MVKGTSRQVILVKSPDQKLFEQAIFILKDDAKGITDEVLLKEAQRVVNAPRKKRKLWFYGPVWACGGAAVTAVIWVLTVFL